MFPETPEIMVVDDHPSNVMLLEQMLALKGYRVRPFLRGRDALESARMRPPDLVLLDINMPDLDGYQTCRLLKQEPALVEVPVIFLSAISQTAGKTEAFRCGGVDYVSKPFEFDEVHARVDAHLKIASLQCRLREQNIQLESVVAARTHELAQAHAQLSRLDKAKSDFLHMISHELRTPLNGLLGTAELMMGELAGNEEASDLAGMLVESRQRILSLVDSALLITQIEMEGGTFRASEVSLRETLASAAERVAPLARSHGVRLDTPDSHCGWMLGNRELIVRAWQALLGTAVRFAAPGDVVTITAREVAGAVSISFDAPSGSIPQGAVPKFFDLFGVSESATNAGSLGLDPAMARRILGIWGSTVDVENTFPRGIRMSVRCPSISASSIERDGQTQSARG